METPQVSQLLETLHRHLATTLEEAQHASELRARGKPADAAADAARRSGAGISLLDLKAARDLLEPQRTGSLPSRNLLERMALHINKAPIPERNGKEAPVLLVPPNALLEPNFQVMPARALAEWQEPVQWQEPPASAAPGLLPAPAPAAPLADGSMGVAAFALQQGRGGGAGAQGSAGALSTHPGRLEGDDGRDDDAMQE